MFTDDERAFIGNLESRGEVGLARVATSTLGGQPHVVPARALLNLAGDRVLVLGIEMALTYKYRQVQRNPKVAIVWDTSVPGHGIKGIEVRGTAVIRHNEGEADPHFEVTPAKVFSWGINEPAADSFESKMGMNVEHLRRRAETPAATIGAEP